MSDKPTLETHPDVFAKMKAYCQWRKYPEWTIGGVTGFSCFGLLNGYEDQDLAAIGQYGAKLTLFIDKPKEDAPLHERIFGNRNRLDICFHEDKTVDVFLYDKGATEKEYERLTEEQLIEVVQAHAPIRAQKKEVA